MADLKVFAEQLVSLNIKEVNELAEILKEEYPDLRLVLVGKIGTHANKIIEWAKSRNIYEYLIFTGFIEDEKLKWLYENAKAYVFTSLAIS